MKLKDSILSGLITLNLLLLAFVGAILLYQSEPVAQAGAAVDRGEFIRMCTVQYGDNREGLAVIDTLENKLVFYVPVVGRKEVVKQGPSIDLAAAYKHPTKP